jgi:thiosulfate dehydrogenase
MEARFTKTFRLVIISILILVAISVGKMLINFKRSKVNKADLKTDATLHESTKWQPPDTSQIPFSAEGDLIRYGRELVVHTSLYLGPKGKVASITNGMNCQNCHLDGGTKIWSNNFSAVAATYPQFRGRSGSLESVYKRVNDCMERSLNGKKLETDSREMKAFVSYINWLGKNVPKNVKPQGAGLQNIPFLNRPADPGKGLQAYKLKCQRCHGADGHGFLTSDSSAYLYPPLWGKNSYNTAAGIFRLTHFAGYIRHNMPFDARADSAMPTDEEAWDVAAFINTQPRPEKKFAGDWPDISRKPFDYPFGPYADSFYEVQHKFGTFEPIIRANTKTGKKKLPSQ